MELLHRHPVMVGGIASEGFLPGFNFPRLPLSAGIPARRGGGADEYLNRPRFVAISEFGPGAFIYHEGSVYRVNRVMIPVNQSSDLSVDDPVITTSAVQCSTCGYLHPARNGASVDRCERCGADLSASQVAVPLAVPHDQRVDTAPGPDQFQFRRTPAEGLRNTHRVPLGRGRRAPERAHGHSGR
jgi:hypothetical protein